MESPESLWSLVPRDDTTCTGSKLWYVCTVGSFRGCCATDPCTTGICPDDDDDTLSSTSAGVSSVTTKTITTSPTSTLSKQATVSSTAYITSNTSTESTGVTSSASPSNTPGATSSNLGAIIGGVVGGVAVLVICAILLFCCCRRKRKHGKREGTTLVSWYKDRGTASEMKGPLSPSDSEAHNSSSAASPFTDNTRSIILTPDLALESSATSLISHSPRKTPIPPTQPHSNELFASIPPRQGFTPELPDTGFHRQRAELASHAQSELINVPLQQRQLQQPNINSWTSPRAWGSPALASIPSSRASPASPARAADTGSGHSHSHNNSTGVSPGRNQAGRVVTAEGVVLGANLDRYSNGMEIGESGSQALGERGRTAERGGTDHVMSFMQYAGDRGGTGLGIETGGITSNPQGGGSSASRPAQRSLEDDIVAAEGHDVPPAYEAAQGAPGHDIKSPSGRMGMSPRGGV
ncbi:hypothetical protein DTO027I6_8115 [Penicillium roqueforti]|nr:hypothetical protein CBS147337_6212 [Penicillium roqueforti]KAI2675993.1 hypothetical protein CBS147355_6174 [Penicillium roqueforti]KAI2679320.1 hypothetical protein LCP963914a_7419 [Penicillium roqueforti]KAI3171456.1 hypothetical protein CBS147317_885 [Penicillium roqueforti]KAI3192227.1 hypothetical protein DTO027I6_8115 [Penicillium roqueforti]